MTSTGYLDGQLLLAMPVMDDPRFERSVILMCTHDESGAMGLIINRAFTSLDFPELLEQLEIETESPSSEVSVHSGGPVEPGRGFVLHSADYAQESTMVINEHLALTATVDILSDIAEGKGPAKALVCLGYAGWGAGQLEDEIHANVWLTAPGEDEIIFHTELDQKWPRTMAMLGIDATMLSAEAGHA